MSDIDRYKQICRAVAPYPLNYLPGGDTQQQVLGAMIGMMIEKDIFFIGFPKHKGGAP